MLTERKELILKAIVGEYISTACPVPSDSIVRKHGLAVSTATVRNEMVDLEEDGYIKRPHTSSGRVPLDKAYRFYVENLGNNQTLPMSVQNSLRQEISQAEKDPEVCIRLAASALAHMAQNMTVVTMPKATTARAKHIELVPIQEHLALLVLVLQEAKIRQQLIHLEIGVTHQDLAIMSTKLRARLGGMTSQEIEEQRGTLSPFEEGVVDAILTMMGEEERADSNDHVVDGLSFLLAQPEFNENGKLREAVMALVDQSLVQTILGYAPQGSTIHIQIGSENPEDTLRPLSVILSRYGNPYQAAGLMAVIGPTRMDYPHAISGIRYLSSLLDDMVDDVIGKQ